ncbi:hypothetical protein BDV28DRAFT_146434 [Aspergillus coremiiformis]|uniref:WAP domain-containing protein n=1 Tax=Aspergillus coremiiformis TaxID=138285 RepID=A0A5N6ZD88_9EURO|nr:hypothetical protein BDV28DRAFT_146434 [Aspergillus coremiiformis]
MKFLTALLLLYAALVASIPTTDSNGLATRESTDTLPPNCRWDWDCPRENLCCKGHCTRTGDCRHSSQKREAITPRDQCNWTSDCRPGDLCCSGRCQSVYDCRRAPPKQPPTEPADDQVAKSAADTKLDKRHYRSREDQPDKPAEPDNTVKTGQACKHAYDCGVTGEHQWACCNGECLKWYPGSTPWIRPKCVSKT